jgi:uncharacterized protein (TIGR02246 family)
MKKTVLLAFLLVLAPTLRAGNAAAEIRAVLEAQTAAWNRGDIDGFMQGYDQSDSLRFASGGTITRGWQAALERYKKHYPDRAAMGTLTFTLIEIKVLSPDAAVVFGQWELARAQDHPHGLFTLTLQRETEGWRIVADHTSSADK